MTDNNSQTPDKNDDITEHLITKIRNMSYDQKQALLKILEDEKSSNQRKHERTPSNVTAMFTSSVCFGEEYIRDISLGGVFIETTEHFEIGQSLKLAIPVMNEERYINVTGKIVRVSPAGIGIEFEKILEKSK